MTSFRLMLCVLGLATYVVAKHLTAPDGDLTGLPPGSHLTGLSLSLAQEDTNAAAMAWMTKPSNARPQLVPPTWSNEAQTEEWSVLSTVAKTKIENRHPTRLGAVPRVERN